MGEGFKRKRADGFRHRRSRYYQALLDSDLFSAVRRTSQPDFEIRAVANGAGLEPGTRCLVIADDTGEPRVLLGNNDVARVTAESAQLLRNSTAHSLRGMLPCEVTRVDPFGGVSLRVKPEEPDE